MTLKDIAAEAGVSTMTVSNVINGKHNRVSKSTVEKINKIITKNNYVPNQSARSLTAKSSKIIALIVPVIEKTATTHGTTLFENPYVGSMLGEIERTLRENGYYPMIRSVAKQTDILTLFHTWNVDGAIFLYPSFDEIIDSLIEQISLPMVFIDSSSQNPNVMNIGCDNEKGMFLSTRYLITHGHRNIAFIADYKNNPLLEQRFLGYKRALEESKIAFNSSFVIENSPTYEGGIKAGTTIASSKIPITGAVTTADICAIGMIEGARLGGMRIPADLSIVGFDDILPCLYTSPKLTTVSQNLHKKASLAANLLIERLTTKKVKQNKILVDVNMIERQSVIDIE
ncbi:LacI family transcriptional regulator [Anaerosacchariphilus polymeriproducens]|uniref:LacI family transcriptional regulator n=2 Tax=Anaerosacchariphilus polymeriproducens TaxID=1812858 RepID=A0A371AZU9_9FIRM|nr:LacI family transcriptional regulator [Anaerosacchariphilus polymeriproducens]